MDPAFALRALPARAPRGAWRRCAPALLLLAAACGDGAGPDLPAVSSLQVVRGNSQAAAAGETLPDSLVVKAVDARGRVLSNIGISWTVESGGGSVVGRTVTAATGLAAASWTLGTTAGNARVRVAAGDVSTAFTATIMPGPVSTVVVSPGTFTLDPGTQRQLQVAISDAFGNAVSGRPVSWETSEPLIATVDNNGRVSGVAGGDATIRARVDGRTGSAVVTVTGPPAPIPTIAAITPGLLTPGSTATITGTNFSPVPGASVVTINGIAAAVSSATAVQLVVSVPGADRLGCLPLAPVEVAVRVGSARTARPHPLQTATRRTLGVSEVIYGTAAEGLGCTELAAGSGRYLLAVYNPGAAFSSLGQQFVSAGPGIQVRTASGAASGQAAPPLPALAQVAPPPGGTAQLGAPAERQLRHLRAHQQVLARGSSLLPRLRLPDRRGFPGQAALVSALPAEGDSLWIRFPDVSKESSLACSQFDSVRARVVSVGSKAIVLEDITAPLAGQVDSMFRQMALQFDQVQYPLVRDHFGDPLLLDGQLNNDGHLYMLFTRRVNGLFGGNIMGFVWSGDFDDGTFCRQSNRAEIFYGIVPTVLTGGGSTDWNLRDWYNYTRSTVVHEVKHVASMAARANQADQRFGADSLWLEEAGAQVAEEIWARQLFGYQQRGNTGFEQSIVCELNLAGSGCTDMPVVMLNHFSFLYDYYERSDSLSVLGRAVDGDATFYGSAWAFLRWLTDHSGMAEAQFLSQLTSARTAGITSVQNLTGKSFEDLFREFVLASALDDRPGFTGSNPRLSQPSWHTRDVFDGMSRLQTSGGVRPWPLPFPMVPRLLAPAGATSFAQVRPGGAALFEFEVPAAGAQVFEVVATDGAVLPPGLRTALVRVQ